MSDPDCDDMPGLVDNAPPDAPAGEPPRACNPFPEETYEACIYEILSSPYNNIIRGLQGELEFIKTLGDVLARIYQGNKQGLMFFLRRLLEVCPSAVLTAPSTIGVAALAARVAELYALHFPVYDARLPRAGVPTGGRPIIPPAGTPPVNGDVLNPTARDTGVGSLPAASGAAANLRARAAAQPAPIFVAPAAPVVVDLAGDSQADSAMPDAANGPPALVSTSPPPRLTCFTLSDPTECPTVQANARDKATSLSKYLVRRLPCGLLPT
jgi:hypothetical protein